MKRLADLTAADLNATAVWRHSGGPDSQATVSPEPDAFLSDNGAVVFIARTEFTLNDGSTLLGYSSPADPSSLDYLSPVILLDARQIPLWDDSQNRMSDLWRALGRREDGVFPIRWRSAVPVDGQPTQGFITAAGEVVAT
jgi:hypothetical protein